MQFFDAHTHSLTHNEQTTAIFNLRISDNMTIPPSGYFSVGIHPYDTQKATDQWIECLTKLSHNERCIAIGETGMDRRIDNFDRQEEIFKIHSSIAQELQKPLIIHCVKAQSEILAASSEIGVARIFHSYSKVNEEISRAQNIVYSLSMRNITHSSAIYLNQILLETDDSLHSIEDIYTQFAAERQMSIDEVVRMVEQNFFRIFAR